MKSNPPRLAEKFFRWFCHHNHLEGLEGDLYEIFDHRVKENGLFKARLFYLVDIMTLIRSSVSKPLPRISTNNIMEIFFSNLKVAFRQGIKRKEFSLINIIGLTLGITSILFITLFIKDEISYDSHITNAENKYRIYNIRRGTDGIDNYLPIVPPVFAAAFQENFEQIEKIGRIINDYGGTIFTIGENSFSETKGFFSEIAALEILDLKVIHGDINNLSERYSVLLSQKTFEKFFGNETFGQQVVLIGSRELKVAGVFENLPVQSHLGVDYIFPFDYAVSSVTPQRMSSWIWQQFFTYVQLSPGTNVEEFTNQVRNFVTEKTRDIGEQRFYYITHFQNIRNIHLHSSNFEWDIAVIGNYQSIVFLAIAAGIILLIAVLNFINLTIAQALKRAKEVSVRKFVGASKSQLFAQYSMESIVYAILAGIISVALLSILLPSFNDFTGKNLTYPDIFTPNNISLYLALLVIIGLLAGIQPAFLLTSFKPLDAVRGITRISIGANAKIQVRQWLVGAQYILSIGLIILSLIIQDQFSFLQNSDMGFDKENLVVMPLTNSLRNDLESTRAAFTEYSGITNLSYCYGVPGGIVSGDGVVIPSKGEGEHGANVFIVDEGYISTMKMRIIAGRDFSKDVTSDRSEGFVVNETAVKNFGLESPEKAIGEPVHWNIWGEDSIKRGAIIGVVEDFNYKSLHNEISNTVLHIGPQYFSYMVLRLSPGDLSATLSNIEKAYRKFEPTRPFDYQFVDQSFDQFYKSEEKLSQLFSIFTSLAIVTAAIGLFGLVSFSVVNRAREISIRKVLGAATTTIFIMLVQRYFIMIALCLLIAVPLSWYIAREWLTNFAYHTNIEALVFVEVGFIIFVLTLVTVGYHAIKGASANPSEKLRTD